MPKSGFGKYMSILRQQKKITQQELAEELGVSIATISRIENGEKKPSQIQHERIMQTLGEYSGDYLSVFLTYEQIIRNNTISRLRCALRDGRIDEARDAMSSIRDKLRSYEEDYQQFILYAETVLADDIDSKAAIDKLSIAFLISKKRLDPAYIANSRLTYDEITILGELANRRAQVGDIEIAIDLLTAVKDSMDRFCVDEREKSVAYPIVLYNLSKLLGAKGLHDKVLLLCATANKMALEYNNMKILPQLVYNIASAKYFKGDIEGCDELLQNHII